MAKIKDLPKKERPREKALLYGIEKLSTAELFALILGNGTSKISVLEVANNLLVEMGGIKNIKYLTFSELVSVKGINTAKALKFLAIKEIIIRMNEIGRHKLIHQELIEYYRVLFLNEIQEKAFVVLLTEHNIVIAIKEVGIGSEDTIAFSKKKVLKYIIQYDAKKFYLIHNHPSGNCTPSKSDITSTLTLEMMSLSVNCNLIDHYVFGKDGYYSINKKEKILY